MPTEKLVNYPTMSFKAIDVWSLPYTPFMCFKDLDVASMDALYEAELCERKTYVIEGLYEDVYKQFCVQVHTLSVEDTYMLGKVLMVRFDLFSDLLGSYSLQLKHRYQGNVGWYAAEKLGLGGFILSPTDTVAKITCGEAHWICVLDLIKILFDSFLPSLIVSSNLEWDL